MKVGDTNRFAYNAQALTDHQEGIIVAAEVNRHETDNGQLVPMIEQGQQNLAAQGLNTLTVADTGYGAGPDLQAAADKHLNVLAPPPEGKSAKGNRFAAKHFTYDESAHSVRCPENRRLDYEGQTHKRGQLVERFRCHCRDCPVRAQCTADPKGRQIEVWPHHSQVQAMRKRLEQPALQKQWQLRSQISERRFAQLKQQDGFRRWTVWGLEGVRTQWSMLCSTLNLRVLYRRWRTSRTEQPKVAAVCLAKLKTGLEPGVCLILRVFGHVDRQGRVAA